MFRISWRIGNPGLGSFFFFLIFIYLATPGLSCSTWDLRCGMQDLVPQPGIEPGPPALGARCLSHSTTREVPGLGSCSIEKMEKLFKHSWLSASLFLFSLNLSVHHAITICFPSRHQLKEMGNVFWKKLLTCYESICNDDQQPGSLLTYLVLKQPYKAGSVIIPILQLGRLRRGKVPKVMQTT